MDVRVFQINEDLGCGSYNPGQWFWMSLKRFRDRAPSTNLDDYDYVQVIPMEGYKEYWCGNNGAQGFRHKETGWTIPDHCRQNGDCPEMWWSPSRRRQLDMSEDSPIWDYIVVH